MWYRTQGSCARSLAVMFGQTAIPMYKWLKFGRRVLLHSLSRSSEAQVKRPNIDEIKRFQDSVEAKYPTCSDVWGAAEGLKLMIHEVGSYQKQLKFYND